MSDLGSAEDVSKVYTERNIAVALAVGLARQAGYPAVVYISEEEPEWPVIFIEIPTGQVSWHIPASEYLQYFGELPVIERNPWDGHSTEDKNKRITRYTGA